VIAFPRLSNAATVGDLVGVQVMPGGGLGEVICTNDTFKKRIVEVLNGTVRTNGIAGKDLSAVLYVHQ
jgi:hypothetical protein